MATIETQKSLKPFDQAILQAVDNESNTELKYFRRDALKQLRDLGLPNIKTQGWRYNRFSKFSEITSSYKVLKDDFVQLVWQDQGITGEIENEYFTWKKVDANQTSPVQSVSSSQSVIRVLNDVLHTESWQLNIKKSIPAGESIELVYGLNENQSFCAKVFVEAQDNVDASIIERHSSDSIDFALNVEKNFKINKNAELRLYTKIDMSHSAVALSNFADIYEDAKFKIYSLNKSMSKDSFFRSEHQIQLKETKASVEFSLGAIANQAGLQMAHVLNIAHMAPNTKSKQSIRSIVGNGARYYFNGCVHIHKGASQSEANQLNKNLLLDEISEVDTKPELIIDHDDVTCSHGASVADLDKTQLNYLMTRGIKKATAHKLLVEGFMKCLFDQESTATDLFSNEWQLD